MFIFNTSHHCYKTCTHKLKTKITIDSKETLFSKHYERSEEEIKL